MRFEVDTHTHTVLSGHAQSTLIENAAAAAKAGVKGIVLTDHGPSVQSAPPAFTIVTYAAFPKHIHGVRIYYGSEVNITDENGSLDIKEKFLKQLDFSIAGLHNVVIKPSGKTRDTDAVIAAIGNTHIDVISHPDNPDYEIDYDAFVKAKARAGKLIEVNQHSLWRKKDGPKNAAVYLELCKKHDVRVAVSSDAHIAMNIGVCDTAASVLEENNFPSELIVNLTQKRFDAYLSERAKRISLR